jgi:hypothetical protein
MLGIHSVFLYLDLHSMPTFSSDAWNATAQIVLVAWLSSMGSGLATRQFHVGFVVDKVTFWQNHLRGTQPSFFSFIPLILHILFSFTCRRCCMLLATSSVATRNTSLQAHHDSNCSALPAPDTQVHSGRWFEYKKTSWQWEVAVNCLRDVVSKGT